MRRIITITMSFILVLAVLVLSMMKYQTVSADTITVSTRDIPNHGLTLLGPASSEYESAMDDYLAAKNDGQKEFVNELKPFSAFIRNTNTRDVVAYKLRWELSGTAIKTITHELTFADPAILMGVNPIHVTPAVRAAGSRVVANGSRFVAVASSISYPMQYGISSGTGSDSGSFSPPVEPDDKILLDKFRNELDQASEITITLDGAVFSDGTFVGPDESGYFGQLKAQIAAKFDILRGAVIALNQNRTPSEIFSHIQTISETSPGGLAPESEDQDYYAYYRQMYATEMLNVRAVLNNDEQALAFLLEPLNRIWPPLTKAQ